VVVGFVAGICGVFSLQAYVWKKTRPHQQQPGDFGNRRDCNNTAVGKSIQDFHRIAQLCQLENLPPHRHNGLDLFFSSKQLTIALCLCQESGLTCSNRKDGHREKANQAFGKPLRSVLILPVFLYPSRFRRPSNSRPALEPRGRRNANPHALASCPRKPQRIHKVGICP